MHVQTLRWGDKALVGLIHGEHRWLLTKQGGRRFRLPFMGSASKTQVTLGQEVSGEQLCFNLLCLVMLHA